MSNKTKATITFTHEQAIAFITEKLQDDFSSNFDFIVSISNINSEIPAASGNTSDNPETIVYNPRLVPDEDGWFMHDPEWISCDPPEYIDGKRKISVEFHDGTVCSEDDESPAGDWSWYTDEEPMSYQIKKWKYV